MCHLSPVTCHLSHVTCHLTTILCSFSCYEILRRLGDATAGGLVIDRVFLDALASLVLMIKTH